ncbi:hypothetical protein [Algiphilus aromaticivorans]|uniref:hypothetical protein n=1 Tax=Algiphilus aromaticivorans TaxID=382454 RepID=UPI0005C18A5B|nr:hypothetical protein [Algiphilus aromaticivorans]
MSRAESEEALHRKLVHLGDLMGDGEHLEPGGGWISREYRRICVALGIVKPKTRKAKDNGQVDARMAERLQAVTCQECSGALRQTRSGSMRAQCVNCGAKFQLLRTVKRASRKAVGGE